MGQNFFKKTINGFTLIELMITVAIIGILASIAIPSYQDSVRKSRRADAEGALMGLANALERKFTENNNYCNQGGTNGSNSCGDTNNTNDTGISPLVTTLSSFYDYKIDSASATAYGLVAVPKGAQSSDKCGTLTLDNIGNRDAKVSGTSVLNSYPECKW